MTWQVPNTNAFINETENSLKT